MTALVAGLLAVVGLAVGSFLNVVVARVPAGESVVRPRSRCPGCGSPIRPRDNVPVMSWLLLRARCRGCRSPITVRYPAVELLTAILFAVVTLSVGLVPALPAFLYLAAVGLALAVIDLDCKRLPDALTLPSYAVGIVLLGSAALAGGDAQAFVRALAGMAGLYTFYFALAFAYPAGMGFGDVKLAGVLGLYLGWLGVGPLVVGAFAAFLFGGVVSLGLMAAGRAGRKSAVPFGPFMLLGALFAVVFGGPVATAYVGSLT